jgi:hypothetical protein
MRTRRIVETKYNEVETGWLRRKEKNSSVVE